MHGLFTVPQVRHSAAQFVDRQEIFLIGRQQAIHALADPGEIALQGLLPLLHGIGRPGRRQTAVEFILDQARILQQAHDLGPDEVIEEILANGPVLADLAAKMAPCVGANAAVIVDGAGT